MGIKSKRIYFLASYPRSGSTWLRLLIDYYLNGEISLEKGLYCTCGDNADEVYQNISPWHLDPNNHEQYAMLRPTALGHMSSIFQMHRDIPTRDVCMKTHNANIPIGGIAQIPTYGTSGALLIVRDPRDVAVSFAKYMNKDLQASVDDICNESLTLVSEGKPPTVISDWNSWHVTWTSEQRFPISAVRYEDMVRDPASYFATVMDLLIDEDVDFKRIDESVAACEFDNLRKAEDKEGFVAHLGKGNFFRAGKAGGWKDILSEDQANKISKSCEKMMEAFNYERD